MNSKERHEGRYQRRVAAREERKRQLNIKYDDYDAVFTFSHLYRSYRLSCKNVGWKASVQKYKANAMINLYETYMTLRDNKFKSKGFYEFNLLERGKLRHIKSVAINERVVQRCLCDYSLVPVLSKSFIYDNSASQKGKGITFALNRMSAHLQKFYRKYGNDGYILQYDFSKYFESLSHKQVYKIIDKAIKDERLRNITKSLVDDFGDIGLGLGSQVSQILSLACANRIDHYMKEVMGAKYYGRYMDDGYIISHDKLFLHRCMKELKRLCDELEIKLNIKKTHISKLSRGFSFLKRRFFLCSTGRLIKKICKAGITRMRRKLKKFKDKVVAGIMCFKDVCNSIQSWIGHTLRTNCYRVKMNMIQLFRNLYKDYIVGGNECIKY